MKRLFDLHPETKSVKKRYFTLKILLQERYEICKENPEIEAMLKDAIYLDRKIRWMTEGEEKELKDKLEKEFVENNLWVKKKY